MISRRFAGEFFLECISNLQVNFFGLSAICRSIFLGLFTIYRSILGSIDDLQVNVFWERIYDLQVNFGVYLHSTGQFGIYRRFAGQCFLGAYPRSTGQRLEVYRRFAGQFFCWECIYDLQVNFGVYRRFAGQFFFWERIYDLQVNFLGLSAIYRSILGYICDLQVNFGVYLRFTGDVWCLSTSAGKFWGLSAICRSI